MQVSVQLLHRKGKLNEAHSKSLGTEKRTDKDSLLPGGPAFSTGN
jgi:hypothetical protein